MPILYFVARKLEGGVGVNSGVLCKTKKKRKLQKRRVFACLGVFGVFGVFGGVEIGSLRARAAAPPVRRVW